MRTCQQNLSAVFSHLFSPSIPAPIATADLFTQNMRSLHNSYYW